MSTSLLQKKNIILIITHSKQTNNIKATIKLTKKNKTKIIYITHNYHSPITKLTNYIIYSPTPKTPLLNHNTSTKILQLTLLNTFFISITQLNIKQTNINIQKTNTIINFFSPNTLK